MEKDKFLESLEIRCDIASSDLIKAREQLSVAEALFQQAEKTRQAYETFLQGNIGI